MLDNTKKRQIPLYPFIRRELIRLLPGKRKPQYPSVLDGGELIYTYNARSALLMGLQALGVKSGDEVLVPGYHCPVMIYPIVDLGCKPVYYKINKDCSVDCDDLQSKISPHTKAVIAVHFFGIPAPLSHLRNICNENGISLIEDCAHSFYGQGENRELGSVGDFSIASLYKFFPVQDGGILRFNNPSLHEKNVSLDKASLFYQMKSFLNSLELRQNPNKRSYFIDSILAVKNILWNRGNKSPESIRESSSEDSVDSPYDPEIIAPTYMKTRAPLFSIYMQSFSDNSEIANQRRKHFNRLLKIVSEIDGIEPLFSELPEGAVPYTFPMLVEGSDQLAALLRDSGIKVGRYCEYYWDESDRHICEVSNRYSKHCIQIPIHQSLNEDDMSYIESKLRTWPERT